MIRAYLKMPAVFALFLLAVFSCGESDDGGGRFDDGTRIVFDNSDGLCETLVFSDPQRRDSDLLAAVPAGAASEPLPHPGIEDIVFFFSYRVSPRGFDDISIVWTPALGHDQSRFRIPAREITTAHIPPLAAALKAPDERLSAKTYIVIQNKAGFSWYLKKGSSLQMPKDAPSYDIIAGQMPFYELNEAPSSAFSIRINAGDISFPQTPQTFEKGGLYHFNFDGSALTLKENFPLTQGNIAIDDSAGGSAAAANGQFANTRWKDLSGNSITFTSKMALLSGAFWTVYSGRTLESAYRAAQNDVVIYIDKDASTGFRLAVMNNAAIVYVPPQGGTQHPFYKED